MGSGAMMYIPSFIKIGSGIQKLMVGIHTHTETGWRPLKITFSNQESRLKIKGGWHTQTYRQQDDPINLLLIRKVYRDKQTARRCHKSFFIFSKGE
jgi:hypothetical protein